MLRLTNSELSDFQRCARMHWLGNVRRLGPIAEPSPLRAAEIGTRYHDAMELYYGGASQAETLAWVQEKLDVHAEITPGGEQHKSWSLVFDMVEGYFDYLAETGLDSGVKVIAPETTHTRTMPEFPDVIFMGKLDLETEEGLEDHKTTKLPFSQKLAELRRSRQPIFYAWLLEPIKRVTRVRFRIARQSTRSERTTGPYYEVESVPINHAMLRSHERHLRELVPQIQANYERTTVPAPAPGSDCSWRCDFYSICPLFDDGSGPEYVIKHEFKEVNPLERYASDE